MDLLFALYVIKYELYKKETDSKKIVNEVYTKFYEFNNNTDWTAEYDTFFAIVYSI